MDLNNPHLASSDFQRSSPYLERLMESITYPHEDCFAMYNYVFESENYVYTLHHTNAATMKWN